MNFTRYSIFLGGIWLSILCHPLTLQAHHSQVDTFRIQLQVGIHLRLGYNAQPSFSYSLGGHVNYYDQGLPWISPSIGISANVSKGTIGTSSHPGERNDLVIDLIGSAFISLGDHRGSPYDFQRIDNFQPYSTTALEHPYDHYAVTLGSSFIVNNKKRHQHIGHFGFSVLDFSLMYFNDGGPIVQQLSLGDARDRWWTGGLHLSIHPRNSDFRWSATYLVYTGYSENAYVLSSLMDLKAVMYASNQAYFLNKGLLSVAVQHKPSGFGAGLDVSGSRWMFLQNFLHRRLGSSLHPSSQASQFRPRFFFHPSYQISSVK
ncbi:MAG: polymorphic toxin type 23 domain-containing protein [Bacteroidota bacterium]